MKGFERGRRRRKTRLIPFSPGPTFKKWRIVRVYTLESYLTVITVLGYVTTAMRYFSLLFLLPKK